MRPLIAILLLCSSAAGPASADYSLPDVKERLVLLLDRKDVGLNEHGLALSVDKIEHEFEVDRFWMQDRIWSDGICVGVQDSDEKSSAARIREVRRAIEMKEESLILLELVRVAGTTEFIVTYVKLFDPDVEYTRYFPKKTYYDHDAF